MSTACSRKGLRPSNLSVSIFRLRSQLLKSFFSCCFGLLVLGSSSSRLKVPLGDWSSVYVFFVALELVVKLKGTTLS